MSGLVALLGGLEHRTGFEELDDRLVAHVVGRRPVVTVLPLASSARKRRPTARLARTWWAERGAVAEIAPFGTDRDRRVAIRMVRQSDLVVFPGGVPDRLHRRLAGTRLWFEVVDAWRRGASVSGASSGAMVLCGRRQSVRPPFRIGTGLGLVPGVAAAPHIDERTLATYARVRTRLDPDLAVMGLDTSTGIVGRDGVFDVLGTGTVRLAHHHRVHVFRPGDRLALADLLGDDLTEPLGADMADPATAATDPWQGVDAGLVSRRTAPRSRRTAPAPRGRARTRRPAGGSRPGR